MTTLSQAEARRLAGAVLLVGFDGLAAPPALQRSLSTGEVAGVVLFRRNVSSASQVRALSASLVRAAADSPLIAVDQEGGRVARLREGVIQLPPMRALGAHGDASLTRAAARALGEELSALGINLNFAPVCDVDSNPANPVIGDRAFGPTPETVSAHAVAVVEGLRDGGVLGCAKHFPGHGDTSTDSHFELPSLRHDRARLEAVELPPFRAAIAAGVATVMSAHVRFEAVDPELPATLSRAAMTGLLRDDLARGRGDLVIVSDDLLMRAVSARWPVEFAAPMAVDAGCDLLLICDDGPAQARARDALAARALAEPAFAARLREAAGRVDALRALQPSRPVEDDAALFRVLERAPRREVEAALGALGAVASGRDPTAR
jgi:beta-N-acetylhexosaminidase